MKNSAVRQFAFTALLLFTTAGVISATAKPATAVLHDSAVYEMLEHVEHFWKSAQRAHSEIGLGDFSFECAVCGIAVNEVEGQLMENQTQNEIESFIEDEICALLSGDLKDVCDQVVQQIPSIVANEEKRWTVSTVCVDLGICKAPFSNHSETVGVPKYVLNLDLPADQRWNEICSNSTYQQLWQHMASTIEQVLPDNGKLLSWFGREINALIKSEYATEIKSCSQQLGVDYGWVTLLNIGYEASDACTSIVAQIEDGTILHGRNLDFWAGMGFTDTLKGLTFEVDIQKSNQTVFHANTFAGFVGILSGMKPDAFAITIDTRFYPNGVKELFYEIVAALEERNATLVGFLARDAFMYKDNFEAAVEFLSTNELICDVYYICSGVNPGEGAVITRNRLNASDIWRLNAPETWYLLETNYDHWKPAPWFDDRRTPGMHNMNAMGQSHLTLDGLWNVLSTKPTLNLQTTYSFLAVPSNGTYRSATRYCPYPCVQ